MTALPFRRIAILGTGLIGGSFALAMRKHFPGISVIGFDRPDCANHALARGAVDKITSDLPHAVEGSELVYIAMPIAATMELLPLVAASADDHSLITDACSTKSIVCKSGADHFRGGARFLGGHPMAGKEHSGVQHADAELFSGAPYALIGTQDDSDPRAKAFEQLVAAIGARPVWCDAETHDWAVGIVSHLPQMVALALARVVLDETDKTGLPLSLAGSGLHDTLRLAGSPYSVWRDILLTNTDNLSRSLDRLQQAIDYLRIHLGSKEIEQEFSAANELYKLLHRKG